MKKLTEIVCDPHTKDALELYNHSFINTKTNKTYQIKNEICIFFEDTEIDGLNKTFQHLYDNAAKVHDFFENIIGAFKNKKEIKKFRQYTMDKLHAKPHDMILEVGIGTGMNLLHLPKEADYYGNDISFKMLKKCSKNIKKWKYNTKLFQALAEKLPFNDNSFDIVFHAGAINFYNDKKKAIDEMVRVAKPGSIILITDETKKYFAGNTWFEKKFSNEIKNIEPPIDLIPKNMKDVNLEYLLDDKMYCLTFNKPTN